MASEEEKVEAILRDYEQVLADLTFNSRPLITHLTMAAKNYAGRHHVARKIVEKIEKRLYEVVPVHRPSCCFYSGHFSFSVSCMCVCIIYCLIVLLPCLAHALLGGEILSAVGDLSGFEKKN